MDIEHTSTDDLTRYRSGMIYWFTIGGGEYGLAVGQLDDDHAEAESFWLDCDGNPLSVADEHIAPADQRAAIAMVTS